MRKLPFYFFLICIIFLVIFPVQGQFYERANQFHSWFYYIGDHKISDNWGIHPEFQFRRTGLGKNPQEFLIRTAINYYPVDNFVLAGGYVYARQYPYGVFLHRF